MENTTAEIKSPSSVSKLSFYIMHNILQLFADCTEFLFIKVNPNQILITFDIKHTG